MDYDNSNGSYDSSRSVPSIEEPAVLKAFAQSLYQFKQNAENSDLFDIVRSFREITSVELIKLLESNDGVLSGDNEVVDNWSLETKFWNLVEVLVGFRYSDEYNDTSNLRVDEFTSHLVIKDNILRNNNTLRELDLTTFWLVHNMNLDDDGAEINQDELQSTKWLNTKIDLQANSKKPDLVSTLDADATLRNNQANKRSRKINEKDAKNDSVFFEAVYKLLLEEKHDEILELCESTNNWTLSTIIAGAHDYLDPEIDGSALRNSEGDEDTDVDSASVTGIKNKLLWRRAVYALSMNPNLNKYERAIYSFLAGGNLNFELTSSWERQLLVLLNNILQHDLEDELFKYLDQQEYSRVLKLPKPDKKFESVSEVLNFLSQTSDEVVKRESQHSIRVLFGAIMTNNVDQLIKNSIELLDSLILSNDAIRNNSSLTSNNTNSLIKESYLLRILIHFIIFMKFLDDNIISDADLVKLVKLYISRLSLYKLYDLIPIYISYIPSHTESIENYSFFLSNIIINKEDRLNQLKHMRILELPLEDIMKRTVERVFEDTEQYYIPRNPIELKWEPISKLDSNLVSSISWFVDSNMLQDCVTSTIALSRRFLSNGKLCSFIELYKSLNITQVVNDFKLERDVMDDIYNGLSESKLGTSSALQIEEIAQYQSLLSILTLIDEYAKMSSQQNHQLSLKLIQHISSFIIDWLSLLLKSSEFGSDHEYYESLRSLYLPYLILNAFNIIKDNQNKELLKEFKKLVLMISNEELQIYEILHKTGDLQKLLAIVVEISTVAFSDVDKGLYD